MIAENQTFVGHRVQLDGSSFKNCTFIRCRLHFAGVSGVNMSGNTFGEGCSWHFEGAASATIEFMTTLYAGGASEMMEATFNAIRGLPPKGAPVFQ